MGLLQLLLTNLQNILKIYVIATKTKDHQLTKLVLQMVSIHVSRLLCCWHCIYQKVYPYVDKLWLFQLSLLTNETVKTLQRIVYISHLCSSYPDIHDRVWCTWRKINVFMCNMYTYEDYLDMVMHTDIHMWKDFAYFVSF